MVLKTAADGLDLGQFGHGLGLRLRRRGADTAEAFAAGIATLIADPERRAHIARAALLHAKRNFDWLAIGEKQRELLLGEK